MSRNVVLYIAMSVDGYIAQEKDDLSFLSIVEKAGEDYGYSKFIKTVDTVILGRRTYDWVIKNTNEFPHAGVETYVVTHTKRAISGSVIFFNGDLRELISTLKQKKGKNIFIDGGATIVHQLLSMQLIDELIISVVPALTGGGIKLFNDSRPFENLKLESCMSYDTGLVQLKYKRHN